ncbi:uncharacterized protein [Paramormyrops kingsleyae]|uniref:uncharacterized protein n=1 Tax=Paramormyrops kingsleyae TaxID=1676925 RepID=UPI000CD61FF5|nr:uncharacterized protein LOC111841326 [Paramormyrops kingsleyae]
MLVFWVLGTFFLSMVVPSFSQSGDGELGSGEVYLNMSRGPSIEPKDAPNESELDQETDPDRCSASFYRCPASARRLKAMRDEVHYLQAIQHGNQAVMENLIQYVSTEMGDQSYQEVIQENIVGIKEDHLNLEEVVKKIVEDLETQLEGGILESLAEKNKILEESLAIETMLSAAAGMAQKLEGSAQTLYSSFTKQLKRPVVTLH